MKRLLYTATGISLGVVAAASAAAPSPLIRACSSRELASSWAGRNNKSGTIYAYSFGADTRTRLALRVTRATGDTLTSSQSPITGPATTAATFLSPDDEYEELYGFLPSRVGTPRSGVYRLVRYDANWRRIWSAAPRTIVEGRIEEMSSLIGSRRTINGKFRTMLLGCADVPIGGQTESAKVFRVVLPARSRDARVKPARDTIMLTDFRYYVSIPRGVMLRQETPSGSTQVVRVDNSR